MSEELRNAGEDSDLNSFRLELLDAVRDRVPMGCEKEELDFAFVCEVGSRLANAEEFQDFIPCRGVGKGHRSRNLRVDGYEIDEADDSIRLLIADYSGEVELQVITKTRAATIFTQLSAFLEESASGAIWDTNLGESAQTQELSGILENVHGQKQNGNRTVSRYRLYERIYPVSLLF